MRLFWDIIAHGRGDAPQHTIPMILELRLSKIGDSLGIVLPEEALEYLKLQEGDTILATKAPARSLRLSPYSDETAKQMAIAQDLMKRYDNTLHALAD